MSLPALFPVRRARLELDRALRGRSLVHRAIVGFVGIEEYRDLVSSLSALVGRCAPKGVAQLELNAAARADLTALEAAFPPQAKTDEAVELYARAIGSVRKQCQLAELVLGTLLGLSWVERAEVSLAERYPTSFLRGLSTWGQVCYCRLQLESWPIPDLHALTELTRGTVLGCFTHLEARWPTRLTTPLTPGVSP